MYFWPFIENGPFLKDIVTNKLGLLINEFVGKNKIGNGQNNKRS